VSLDLAGHGASGRERTQWTIPAFGQDVAAVVKQLGLECVVLIGHSMGGAVIAEAAQLLSAEVIGMVGAETWHDVEHVRTPVEVAEFLAPFRTDFVEATRSLAQIAFAPTSDATLVESYLKDVATFPPDTAIAVWEERGPYDRVLQERLRAIRVPKIAINSTYPRTTNTEATQRCEIEVVLMSGVGHFVMMEDPPTFNRLLGEAIQELVSYRAAHC
jgi:pimeloyl-ACP methyl ester carboxylesterase